MNHEKIRESAIAGTWYPDHPETLKKQIGKYLDQVQSVSLGGSLVGLVVPHAGYVYSGGIAAHAYKLLQEQPFDRVLIVAPSHRAYFSGASISRSVGFRTPLGVVPLDQELIASLCEDASLFSYVSRAETQEHSLEIQLPFLQVVLPAFRLTPILMGDQSPEACHKLSAAIVGACAEHRILLIASSDLSHFHPYQEAKRLDQVVIDQVSAFDPDGLATALATGTCEACGGGPMITVMLAAQKLRANKAKILQYANSGDVTGDTRGVVGYLAAAFLENPGKGKKESVSPELKAGIDLGLSPDDRRTLRQIALEAIRSKCLKEPMPDIPVSSAKLKEPRGAFVSLHRRGDLRGCIGMIEGFGPLFQTVREMAVQAAFADPRFSPMKPDELSEIELEISVLTPLERIKDPSRIEIGKHGLLIRKKSHSGLLLPQVATAHGWDRQQFLEWACRKASLPPKAWQDSDTEIFVFSADVF